MKKRTYRNSSKPTKNRQYFNTTDVRIDLKRTKRKAGKRNTTLISIETNIILLCIIVIVTILVANTI